MPSDAFYFKDFKKDLLSVEFSSSNKKDTIPQYKWKLLNESKKVLEYLCKKATTKAHRGGIEQSIVAWDTEEIPVNDGPHEYSLLLGFILELEGKKCFALNLIN